MPIRNTCLAAKKGSEIYTNFTSCASRVPLPLTPALPSPTPLPRLLVTMTVEANTSQCKLGLSLCQGAGPSSLTIRPLFILSQNLAFFLILSGDIYGNIPFKHRLWQLSLSKCSPDLSNKYKLPVLKIYHSRNDLKSFILKFVNIISFFLIITPTQTLFLKKKWIGGHTAWLRNLVPSLIRE